MDQAHKALEFQALHLGPEAFIIPNAWDGASARLYENLGFEAIATASAAISWAHGRRDGEHLTLDEMIAAVGRIIPCVDAPVTADMEKGYGETPEEVAKSIVRVMETGIVGINIEDSLAGGGLRDLEDMAARIQAVREAANALKIPLLINARPDVYPHLKLSAEAAFEEVVRRANAYEAAGADSIFVIGCKPEIVGAIGQHLKLPVNVLAGGPRMPDRQALEAMGIRRISLGPRLMQATLGTLFDCVKELKERGSFSCLDNIPDFGDIDALFGDNATAPVAFRN
ncbi:MAG: isocitrate lyase/phosphoenolpyruvate mutase family protein [Fimbriimonadaceae bacterium]|nr:isocitrate lyase/phosphoenolpyruvate mutase family protein [Alphaproteobacteria bacterium]